MLLLPRFPCVNHHMLNYVYILQTCGRKSELNFGMSIKWYLFQIPDLSIDRYSFVSTLHSFCGNYKQWTHNICSFLLIWIYGLYMDRCVVQNNINTAFISDNAFLSITVHLKKKSFGFILVCQTVPHWSVRKSEINRYITYVWISIYLYNLHNIHFIL